MTYKLIAVRQDQNPPLTQLSLLETLQTLLTAISKELTAPFTPLDESTVTNELSLIRRAIEHSPHLLKESFLIRPESIQLILPIAIRFDLDPYIDLIPSEKLTKALEESLESKPSESESTNKGLYTQLTSTSLLPTKFPHRIWLSMLKKTNLNLLDSKDIHSNKTVALIYKNLFNKKTFSSKGEEEGHYKLLIHLCHTQDISYLIRACQKFHPTPVVQHYMRYLNGNIMYPGPHSTTRVPSRTYFGADFLSVCIERGEVSFLKAYCEHVRTVEPEREAQWRDEQRDLLLLYGVLPGDLSDLRTIRTHTMEEEITHLANVAQQQGTPWLDKGVRTIQFTQSVGLDMVSSWQIKTILLDILSRPEQFMENLRGYNEALSELDVPDIHMNYSLSLDGDTIHHLVPETEIDPQDERNKDLYVQWLMQTQKYLKDTFDLELDVAPGPIPSEEASRAVENGRVFVEGFSRNQVQHDDIHILQLIALFSDPRMKTLFNSGITIKQILRWLVRTPISGNMTLWTMYLDNMPRRGRIANFANLMKSHKYLGGPNAVSQLVMGHTDERFGKIQRIYKFKTALRYTWQSQLTGIRKEGLAALALHSWELFLGPVKPTRSLKTLIKINSIQDAKRAIDSMVNTMHYEIGIGYD